MDENAILDAVYALYEGDDDGWGTTDDEYLAARQYANAAIAWWEHFKNVRWNELWGSLDDAADGDKTQAAGDYEYDCPTNMRFPASWVRTLNNGTYTMWTVIKPEKTAQFANSKARICWFTGSPKDGFVLNFNPNVTLSADTIKYEYYKKATTFDSSTDETEMQDPYLIVYYVLMRMKAVDGEDNKPEKEEVRMRMDNMESANYAGYFDIEDTISETLSTLDGFGISNRRLRGI